MFFLLMACLGQSLSAQFTPAVRLPTPVASVAQATPATQLPVAKQNAHREAAKLPKHTEGKADTRVHAIALTKCDMMGDYDIPAQRYDETMQQIAHATGCGITNGSANQAESDMMSAVMVAPVRGHMSVRDAMLMALKGTRYKVVREADNILYVRLSPERPAK